MNPDALRRRIEALAARPDAPDAAETFRAFRDALDAGTIRAATRDADDRWRVHAWVKTGILLGFRLGVLTGFSTGPFAFFDKHTYPPKTLRVEDGVRVVPGGSAIRSGAYVAPGVVCMPPMYVNVGAYVDADTMIDSHALVGSCAQIGRRVHLSAAAQIGGVLEPAGALPVIVEDDAFIGGGCGVYEGCLVRERAVLAPGVTLTRATRLFDLVRERVLTAEGGVLEVPAGAVVVPGTRPAAGAFAAAHGLALYAPVIVKYRDARTDAATTLEDALRNRLRGT
ncbi:2,3,4,5-tetrahydropyridine-2,6-dicarboxylate N-succinyltransferase [Rhodocaloribacter sp.]